MDTGIAGGIRRRRLNFVEVEGSGLKELGGGGDFEGILRFPIYRQNNCYNGRTK